MSDEAQVIGLARYRRLARPSTGSVGLWLDDLFTDPEHRGKGIGRVLIKTAMYVTRFRVVAADRWTGHLREAQPNTWC